MSPLAPRFVPPVDRLNRGGATLWGNLGDWSGASSYPAAAEALALRLGRAAALGPGHHVLDVGCGAGDQLRLWVEAFDVARVTAIELDADLAGRAAERVRDWGLEAVVTVVVSDGLGALPGIARVDRVISLDAAYFLRSRVGFLAAARASLEPGGVLALADLVLGRGPATALVRAVAPRLGIPRSSLMTPTRWREALASAGFEGVVLDACTDDVLGGFARWALGQPEGGGTGLTGFARLVDVAVRTGGVGYAIVTARTPGA